MAALTCPYCGHAIESEDPSHAHELCPQCGGELLVAYRYRLTRARGEVPGGFLYEALDAGFDNKVAVLFVASPEDREASARFVAGHQLFANLRTRGLVTIHDVARVYHRRPYVVMDWLPGGTLDRVVQKRGPLDPGAVWAMTSDLLIGLERAHRGLPALVHGHIHPGKIGFRGQGQAVLFGFEWARLVSEQDSSLADSFQVREHEGPPERASSLDLRELTRAIVFAATGRWLERGELASMRQQVAALMPGPLAPFLDRMCCAGTPEGYHSTSVARDEFELLRAGGNARRRVAPPRASTPDLLDDDHDHDDHEPVEPEPIEAHEYPDHDDHDDHDHDDHAQYSSSPPPPPTQPSFPSKAQNREAEHAALLEQIRRRQAQLAAESSTSAPVAPTGVGRRVAMLLMFGMIGTCVVGSIVADLDQSSPPPPMVRSEPYDWSEPAQPMPIPAPVEPLEPELAPSPGLAQLQWVGDVEAGGVGPLAKQATCRLAVFPRPEEPELRCYWTLDCFEGVGWVRYYGNEGSGMTRCEFDEQGRVTTASDLDDDDGDGLFVFDQHSNPPRVLFGDRFAVPPRAMLIDVGQPLEPTLEPVATSPLERRDSALDVDAKQFTAATRTIGKLADKLGVVPQLTTLDDAIAAELPDLLDVDAAIETLTSLDYAACAPPEGLEVLVDVTVKGATGKVVAVDLGELEAGPLRRCLQRTLSSVPLGRFNADEATFGFTLVP